VFAKNYGTGHPNHVQTNPVVPYYSYSMNAYLGSRTGDPSGYCETDSTGRGGIYKRAEITRTKSDVFFFSAENMWQRPGNTNVLNDNALCGDGRDWFGTFHGATAGDLNSGTVNAIFVDAHVGEVTSGLRDDPSYTDEMEFGRFEKYSWPHKEVFR
jgi:hypothetical protein